MGVIGRFGVNYRNVGWCIIEIWLFTLNQWVLNIPDCFRNKPPIGSGLAIRLNHYPGQARVLNLFAYTGGATVAAAQAGATVCHIDAAKGMVAWAKENLLLSGMSERPVRFIVDDVVKFVQREIAP